MDKELRASAFQWLREQYSIHGGVIPRSVLEQGFEASGQKLTLVGPSGIWKPMLFERIPLSITSIAGGPYDDTFTEDGFLLYRYRGNDPNHRDNVGLREAMRTKTPLIYFHGIIPGRYVPVWPVFIVEDDPKNLSCLVAVDPAYTLAEYPQQESDIRTEDAGESAIGVRRYIAAITKRRLHQTAFRERVIAAYSEACALCKLRHRELLDASHIIPDTQPRGDPIVPNGISLCKIHHAAYDQDIIGISPDYVIHIREDILEEINGPMLQHGLKGLHQGRIVLPHRSSDRPDRDRLAWRFSRFMNVV